MTHDDVIKWKHFRITDPLCGDVTGPRRIIPLTKASDAELCYFLWSAPEQTVYSRLRRFETLLRSLWRHCNVLHSFNHSWVLGLALHNNFIIKPINSGKHLNAFSHYNDTIMTTVASQITRQIIEFRDDVMKWTWPFLRNPPPITEGFSRKGPVMRRFYVLYVVGLNNLLNKQSSCL